eukprot:c6313_g1_i1.p1 GENE.c6313_g1_i1~~c6313_g1_i1.p1  ORF type:complete len:352 (+),score=87.96 c6313_g1_i1:1-1056(+)
MGNFISIQSMARLVLFACLFAVCLAVPTPSVGKLNPEMLKVSVGGGEPGAASPSGPHVMHRITNGDVDAYAEFRSRFDSQFKNDFINWANSIGLTYNGNRLNIINAVILGFPPSPVPATGHVTHDFMTQLGGLSFYESQPITYDIVNPEFVPLFVHTVLYKQDSNETALHKLTYSQSLESSQTLSVTTGISTEITTEETVGVPELGLGSKLSATIRADMSTTSSNTESRTDSWDSEEDITIPANSVTNGTCFIEAGHLDTPFHGTLTATGQSNIGWVFYDDTYFKGDNPWFLFFQTDQTADGLMNYVRAAGSSMNLDIAVSGVYHGTAGTRVQCEVHSCPYTPTTNECYRL